MPVGSGPSLDDLAFLDAALSRCDPKFSPVGYAALLGSRDAMPTDPRKRPLDPVDSP
jgi:hypothetical protein